MYLPPNCAFERWPDLPHSPCIDQATHGFSLKEPTWNIRINELYSTYQLLFHLFTRRGQQAERTKTEHQNK